MNILIVTGTLFPLPSNNANLISKLTPYLSKEHEIHFLSLSNDTHDAATETFLGFPVHRIEKKSSFLKNTTLSVVSRMVDHGGYSDYSTSQELLFAMKTIRKQYRFDAVIATSEPFAAALAVSRMKNVKKILYIMDPPDIVLDGTGTPFRIKEWPFLLQHVDAVLTTPFIKKELSRSVKAEKLIPVGFPLIDSSSLIHQEKEDGAIDILYCGGLYGFRDPKYFMKIAGKLDDRFRVTFMGRGCEGVIIKESSAEIVSLGQQPYETALERISSADILVNIGNSLPVHLPSKLLEYINTGKPILNFYKREDCPSLELLKTYPYALSIPDGADLDESVMRVISFCEQNRNRRMNRLDIVKTYQFSTAAYISKKIQEILENGYAV